jgi:cytochrome c-type biogenesis protein CcmH
MKAQVKDMLAAGYDEEQVLSDFEGSYGEFVRLRPPLRGINWLVWLAPLVGLLAGAAFVARVLRATTRAPRAESPTAPPANAPSGRDTLPSDPELAAHVLRVRALAYGWPDGRSPAARPQPAPLPRP